MGKKAREYKRSTVRKLDILSGNKCYAPNCNKPLIGKDERSIIAKICHIEAADVGGPRYNVAMSDDDRRSYDNLILLCDECHTIIDNPANAKSYTVSLLKQWKKDREFAMYSKLISSPSLLMNAINAISSIDFDDKSNTDSRNIKAYNIEEKIKQNAVKRNKHLFDEYKVFYNKVNSLYDELEIQGSFKKNKLLRYIRNLYLEVKGKYVNGASNEEEIIRENSDNIIEDVQERLLESVEQKSDLYKEDMIFCITIILVDAFIRCKILEEPQ